MTSRLVGGLAATTLAVGILAGAAGTIMARDAVTPQTSCGAAMGDHMGDQDMGSMMSGSMMSGSMMSGSMMGPGSSFGPGMMVPNSSSSPGMMNGSGGSAAPGNQHDQHHPAASQDGAK